MRRTRRFAAIFALIATALSLSEGQLAPACTDAGTPEMAMHDTHASKPDAAAHAPSSTQTDQSGPGCPMTGAAMVICGATALVTIPALGIPAVAVRSDRAAPGAMHIPPSNVTLGLFRPPIA